MTKNGQVTRVSFCRDIFMWLANNNNKKRKGGKNFSKIILKGVKINSQKRKKHVRFEVNYYDFGNINLKGTF